MRNSVYCKLAIYIVHKWLIFQIQAAADKGKEKKEPAKGKDKPKSAGKGKGGGKKTPEPPSAKEESKLRKRGEEDDTGKYMGK